MTNDRKLQSSRDIPDAVITQHEQRRDEPPPVETASPPAAVETVDAPRHDSLFPNEETNGYRTRWEAIQTGFVDQPRSAVEQADALVSELLGKLTDVFSRERTTLEQQWHKSQDNVSTEDLRVALRRYRAFFDRLLSI